MHRTCGRWTTVGIKTVLWAFVLTLACGGIASFAMVDTVRPADVAPTPRLPTVDSLRTQVEQRMQSIKDIRVVMQATQYDPATQKVINEVAVEVQAVAPSVARVTFQRPDYLMGNVYVIDYAADEAYLYYPLYDLAQCERIDTFLDTVPIQPPDVNALLSIPNGDDLGDIDVVRMEEFGGTQFAVLKVTASDRVAQKAADEGIEDLIEDAIETTLGLEFPVDAADIMYLWVDMEQQIVRRAEVVSATGQLKVKVETSGVRFNTGLSINALKTFRGAEIRRCR